MENFCAPFERVPSLLDQRLLAGQILDMIFRQNIFFWPWKIHMVTELEIKYTYLFLLKKSVPALAMLA